MPDFERQIIAQENALDLLLGRNPGPIARGVALADQYDRRTYLLVCQQRSWSGVLICASQSRT